MESSRDMLSSFIQKKYGYGELWLRMAEEIKGQIKYDASVHAIDFDTNTVTTKEGETYSADVIISTIPWMEFAKNRQECRRS